MFSACRSITSLDLSNWNTSNVTTTSEMFRYASAIKSLDLSHFDMSKVTTVSYMFNQCYSLENIIFPSLNMPLCTNMTYFIYSTVNCRQISFGSSLSSGTLGTSALNYLYGDNYYTTEIDCTGLDASSITNPTNSFCNSYALEKVILPASLHYIGASFFANDRNLKTIVLPSTTLVTLLNTNAFSGCSRAKTIYVPDNLVSSYQTADNWKSLTNVTFAGLSTLTS